MWAVLIVLMCFERSNLMQFDSSLFNEDFDRWIQWNGDSCSVFNIYEIMVKILGGLDVDIIASFLNFETCCSISAALLV